MASWAAIGIPSGACAGPVTMMSAASSSKRPSKRGEQPGLMDWLNNTLDKDHFSEMDPVLKKVEGGPPRPSVPPPPKKAASAAKSSKEPAPTGERGFSGLFGLFGKK